MAQFEPKQKGAILLRLFQNLALARGTFWPKLVAHFEPFYPVIINRKSIGTIDAVTITFDKTFKIKEYSDVLLEIETLSSKNINDEVLIARYPTNGYKVTLRYSKEFEYDSCWFNSIQRKDMSELNSEQQIAYPDGISVVTNDWILPGNGVTLCWYHKNNLA